LKDDNLYSMAIDKTRVYLIGHSRGGGIVLIKGSEDKRITAIAAWASVSECKTPWGSWTKEKIQHWEETGVDYYTNSRTKQQMPLYYQLYEDFQNNKERLDILKAAKNLNIPLLVCHGTEDEAVPVANAHLIQKAAQNAELFLVESDHVFGRKHPWTTTELPHAMQAVVTKTIGFFKTASNSR